MLNIVWFKRDLRVTDHLPLVRAVEHGMVVPLYVIEPDFWSQPTSSARQWRFIARALAALRTSLAILGAPLVVRMGDICEVLDEFHQSSQDMALWSHEETGGAWVRSRNRRVADWAAAKNVPWHEFPQDGVIRTPDASADHPDIWDRRMAVDPHGTPEGMIAHGLHPGRIVSENLLYLDEDPCIDLPAGPTPARRLLEDFLERLGGADRSGGGGSHLSTHLAHGTVSTRELVHAVRDSGSDGAIVAFLDNLRARCARMQALEDSPDIEPRHAAVDELSKETLGRLTKWLGARSGLPLADAAMNALTAEGSLSHPMRALLARVAVQELGLAPEEFGPALARLLTDFEPGIFWTLCREIAEGSDQVDLTVESAALDPDGAFLREWAGPASPA